MTNKSFSDIKISVIIPTYNRKLFLFKAIESVFKQSEPVDEVIVIDNNSDDGTQYFIRKKFPMVKILNIQKRNVSIARNLGIKEAKFDWIAFLDSDDQWNKNKIREQKKKLIASGGKLKFIHTDELWFKDNKHFNQSLKHKKKEGDLFKNCLNFCTISPSSVIIYKEIFFKYGFFNDRLPVCEDYELWIKFSSKVEIGLIKKALVYKYGGHSDQLSRRYWGIDRFRVRALEKIYFYFELSDYQKILILETIIKKSYILTTGAAKRNNSKISRIYNFKINYWTKKKKLINRFYAL